MGRSDFRFLHRLRVRWSECDAQGIVFNAQMLNFIEVGTQEYCHNLGFSIYKVAAQGSFDIVTAQLSVQFKAPARVDEMLDIGLRFSELRNRSMVLDAEVFRIDELEPIVLIQAINVAITPGTIQPIDIPDDFRAVVQHFEQTGTIIPVEQFAMLRQARSADT